MTCGCNDKDKDGKSQVSQAPGNVLEEKKDGLFVPNQEVKVTSEDGSVDVEKLYGRGGQPIYDLSSAPHLADTELEGTTSAHMPKDRTVLYLDEGQNVVHIPNSDHSKNTQELFIIRKDGGRMAVTVHWPLGVSLNGVPGPAFRVFTAGNMLHLVRRPESGDWNTLIQSETTVSVIEEIDEKLNEIRQGAVAQQYIVEVPEGTYLLDTDVIGRSVRATSGYAAVYMQGATTPLAHLYDFFIDEDGTIRLVQPTTQFTHFVIETRERVGNSDEIQAILDNYRTAVAAVLQDKVDLAEAEADRAKDEADSSKEEADRAKEEADRSEEYAEILENAVTEKQYVLTVVSGQTIYSEDDLGNEFNLSSTGIIVSELPYGLLHIGQDIQVTADGHLELVKAFTVGTVLLIHARIYKPTTDVEIILNTYEDRISAYANRAETAEGNAFDHAVAAGLSAGESANSADAALLAQAGAEEVRDELTNLTAQATQLPSSATPTANYNPTTGVLELGIPATEGGGDMKQSYYDPDNKKADVYDMDNMAEGTNTKIMTSAERTKLAGAVQKANDTGLGGFAVSGKSLGNLSGSLTPTHVGGNYQAGTITGALTINAPTALGVYDLKIELLIGAGAGAVTLAGFDNTDFGEAFTTAEGDFFILQIEKGATRTIATVRRPS